MGIIHLGAPFDVIPNLAKTCGIRSFVETGTLFGGTSKVAATHFERVYTIERSETLHERYSPSLRGVGNIEPLLGDSRVVLPHVLSKLGNAPALFWLDGHWSGGETAGEKDECPLMDELRLLKDRQGDVILIDDARLFLSAPAAPHVPEEWPTMLEIISEAAQRSPKPYVQVIDDVIYIVPPTDEAKKILIDYGRVRALDFWSTYDKGRSGLARKVARRIAKLAHSN